MKRSSHPTSQRSQTGFTLVELMVTLGIVGILAALSVVGGRAIVAASRVNSAASAMAGVLRDVHLRARSGRCAQVMYLNPRQPFSPAIAGYPALPNTIVETSKRDCGPYAIGGALYANELVAWNFQANTNPNWSDKVVNTHSLTDFIVEPQITAPAGLVVSDTQAVAIAFNEVGALAGMFTVSMPAGTPSNWKPSTSGLTLVYSDPGTSLVRTVQVAPSGDVTLP